MTIEALPAWGRELLATARVARLAFVDRDELPRVLPVTFAVAEGAVWSAIDRKPKRVAVPARVESLLRRPEAAICVDRYDDDWDRLAWVQLLGRVEVLELERAGAGLAALRRKYPQYEREAPQGPVLRLDLDRALSWRAADTQ